MVMRSIGPKQAVVIGYDAVSPLGIDFGEQWKRALEGESGIGRLTRFPLGDGFPVRVAGELAGIDHLDYPFLKPREQARWVSPLFKYALLTVQRALEKSGLEIDAAIAPRVAVTYSSAVGGLDAVLKADRNLMAGGGMPLPCIVPNSCINMVAGRVSILTGATGPITTSITACATGSSSMILGAMLLADDRADVAICGAADLALVEPIVAGFSTMNAAFTPKEGEAEKDPAAISRPFSIDRAGFVISEGAACVILATAEFASAHGLPYSAAIAGWSMTSDAHHFVAPNYATVRRCIAESIDRAGIPLEAIGAVNAHAASTRVGDQVEFDALQSVFGRRMPPVTAHKSMIGHAMGASSAIESTFAFEAMREGVLPPTINYLADPKIPIDCVAGGRRRVAHEYALKNAFGFGGCNACIVFRKTD